MCNQLGQLAPEDLHPVGGVPTTDWISVPHQMGRRRATTSPKAAAVAAWSR